ncbi:MAG: DUF4239 domain-containing protein [Rubritepida sp.]|nr:DUF4239 domain-containing protein [Rubritepida sp.]
MEKPVNDAAMDGVKTVTTFLVLVLAFSLNLVMGQHRQVEEQVQREATLINQLDRGLLRTGPPELVALRPVLIAYASSLVLDEWPRMAVGGRSQEAYALYNALSRGIRGAEVTSPRQQAQYAELVRNLESLSDVRDARLMNSRLALPGMFWVTILGGCLLLLPLCAMTAGSLNSALLKLAMGGSLGMLMALVIIIDRPFSGETQVAPAPIDRAIQRNLERV